MRYIRNFMLQIAIQMLLSDKIKYFILICALSFSTLLMTQQTSVFLGVMGWIVSIMKNSNVPIWVVDPYVEEVTTTKPMRDTDLYRVKSVSGVEWAVPLYISLLEEKLYSGQFRIIILVGVDSTTLLGVPPTFVKGKLENLWHPKAVFIDSIGIRSMSQHLKKPLAIGDLFDINDHEVRIEGIVDAEPSFDGWPYIYTTYERAVAIAPPTRRTLSAILVKPLNSVSPENLAKAIREETGLKAMTSDRFFWDTIKWYFINTGIPFSFGTTIALGFLIGIAVTGQTFYSFVNENLGNFGALKAMGASEAMLRNMLLVQAFAAGFVGYGIGLGLATLFGMSAVTSKLLPFYLSWEVCAATLVMILLICYAAAVLGIRKVRQLEASEVFRV